MNNRQLLLSLLAATSAGTPLGAMANVSLNDKVDSTSKWLQSGIIDQPATWEGMDLTTQSVTIPYSASGYIYLDLKDLPKGTYNFVAGTANNVAIEVSGNGVTTTENAGGAVKFTVANMDTDVVLKVKSADGIKSFQFGHISFSIEIDNNALYTQLTGQLNDLVINRPDAQSPNQDLEAAANKLQTELNTVTGLVNQLQGDEIDLDTYKNAALGLYDVPSTIEERVTKLIENITTHNANVQASDTALDNKKLLESWTANASDLNNASTLVNLIRAQEERITQITDTDDKTFADAQSGYLKTVRQVYEEYIAFLKSLEPYAIATENKGSLRHPEAGSQAQKDVDTVFEYYNALQGALQGTASLTNAHGLDKKLEPVVDAIITSIADYHIAQTNITTLTNFYNKGMSEVMMGITGEYGTAKRQEFTDVYNAGLKALESVERKTATERKTGDQKTFDETKAKLQQILDETQANQKALDNAMSAAAEEVTKLQKKLDELNKKINDLDACDGVKALKSDANAIQEQINTLKTWLEANKENHSLTIQDGKIVDENYTAQAIQTAIDELSGKIKKAQTAQDSYEANHAILGDWGTKLQKAVDAIVAAQGTSYPVIKSTPAADDKLYESYEPIASAIAELTEKNGAALAAGEIFEITDNSKTYVEGAIPKFEKEGVAMAKAFTATLELYTTLNGQLTDCVTYRDTITILGEQKTEQVDNIPGWTKDDLPATTFDFTQYQVDIEALGKALDSAYNDFSNKEQYDEIRRVLQEWTDKGLGDQMASALNELAQLATRNNFEVLNNVYDAYKTALDATDAATTYGPTLDALKEALAVWATEIADQKTAVDNAGSQADIPAYCEEQNKAIQTLVQDLIRDMDQRMANAKTNVTNNKQLQDLLGTDPNVVTWVRGNSTEPAQAGWIPEATGLDTEYTTLVGKVKEAYDKGQLDNDKTEALKTEIEEYFEKVGEFKGKVTANENTYKGQVAHSEQTSAKITDARTTIEGKYDPNVLIQGEDEQGNPVTITIGDTECTTVKDLLDLLDTYAQEVTKISNESYKYFKEHTSVDNNETVTNQYNTIQEYVDQILQALNDDYTNSVIKENQATAAELFSWAELDKAYKLAVDTYNRYIFAVVDIKDITVDDEYKGLITDALKDHAGIQEYFAKIEQLKKDVKVLTESTTGDADPTNDLLTDADFADLLSYRDDYMTFFTNYTAQVIADAQTFAQTMYDQKLGAANTLVTSAETAMEDAGISPDIRAKYLKDAKDYISQAEAMWADKTKYKAASLWMGNIIALLDKVSVRTNDAARDYWNTTYGDAVTRLDNIMAELDILSERTNVQKYINNVREVQTAIQALDDPAAIDITNVKGQIEKLNEQLDIAKQALSDAINEDTLNNANKDAATAFTSDIESLWEKYQTMVSEVGALDLTPDQFKDVKTRDAKNAITMAESTLEKYRPTANDNRSSIEQSIDAAQRAINTCYNTAYTFEKRNLDAQINQIKLDFNNMKASGTPLEKLTEWDTALSEQVDALKLISNPNDPDFDYSTALAAMVKIEEALDNLQEQIGLTQPTDNNSTAAADQAFNDKASTVEAALGEVQTLLNSISDDTTVKTELNKKLEELNNRFTTIKDGFELEGNNKVATLDDYLQQLDDLRTAINSFEQEVNAEIEAYEAEQAKQQESNQAYTDLRSELEALQAQRENCATMLADYGMTEDYTQEMELVITWLESGEQWLETEKESYTLTANSALPNGESIKQKLDYITRTSTSAYTTNLVTEATDKVQEAETAVMTGTHANQAQLEEDLFALQTLLQDERLIVTNDPAIVSDVKAIYDQIMTDAEALIANIQENTVVPGDANQSGDVTMSDYMAMLSFVLGEQSGTFDPTDKGQVASDINGDGRINVADLTSLLNLIMGYTDSQVRVMAHMPVATGTNTISIVPEAVSGDVTRYAIMLNNANAMVNMQLDLHLSEGQEIVNELAGERVAGMDMYTADLPDGTHRVVFAATEITEIAGNEGAVMYIEVSGRGNIAVTNAMGSNANATLFEIADAATDTSFIDQIKDSVRNGVDRIYNAGGVMLRKLQRGINIIRRADGTTEKIVNNK